MSTTTTLLDVVHLAFRPCSARMDRAPWWTCGLAYGHGGDHAKVALSPFGLEPSP